MDKEKSQILVLVEGNKTDYNLMNKLLEIYGISDSHEVVSYHTNIYTLYQEMFQEGDPASVDLLQNLKEHEPNPHKGGHVSAPLPAYRSLVEQAIRSGHVHLVDLELLSGDDMVRETVELAHRHQVRVILSNHDFAATPKEDDILRRLHHMEELGADIAKIAVMPRSARDVLTLLSATDKASQSLSCPVITMSMKGTGLISRLSGEVFGSCLTFGSVKEASAPGQIEAGKLKDILTTIHENL